ncbi:glycerate kinase [Sinirhodobacter ferrireducens]|uniref:Glycerate kinase n=1 Tax=Paenirhodobacter ferrireducens TaxID=1215032 RepID=A0A443LJJ5_9RHOB|nr:glycerate kinase [Sinirhodobacter ferrireducens]RWR49367.1 glycerate kinase [Sinirhodobacter ferrireducens]
MAALTPPAALRAMFDAAVAAADPMRVIPAALPPRPGGRVVVVGAGKASARMAEAVEAAWGPCEGLVITRYGYGRPCRGIEIVEAAHPVPDAAGVAATRRMLDLLASLGEDDFVLALISGGGSALLCAPVPGLTLAEKQAVTTALLASGAPIDRINTLRKHLSAVKGGQLAAAAWPARMLALVISDVPGDDLAFIASGPTVGDGSTVEEARAVLARYGIAVPEVVRAALSQGSGVLAPGDARLARTETRIVAAPSQSLAAAAEVARAAGCEVRLLGDAIEGEAAVQGAGQAALARQIAATRRAGDPPVVLLSGGECTVTLAGADGRGGPNAEFTLAALLALDGAPGIWAIACDTDGVDGAEEVAGALIGPATLAAAAARGLDARAALARHDAHGFFGAAGAQVVTGPTLTNVNDFRAVLIV